RRNVPHKRTRDAPTWSAIRETEKSASQPAQRFSHCRPEGWDARFRALTSGDSASGSPLTGGLRVSRRLMCADLTSSLKKLPRKTFYCRSRPALGSLDANFDVKLRQT